MCVFPVLMTSSCWTGPLMPLLQYREARLCSLKHISGTVVAGESGEVHLVYAAKQIVL
jgi:hypothetical protein